MRSELHYVRYETFDWWLQRLLPMFALGVALLMVSRIPYPHAVTHALRGKKTFPQFVAIVFALMALWAVRWYAVPAVAAAYAMGPPAVHAWHWSRLQWRRRVEKAR
jgi:CDP-diacylglycerol---serine O-phosphatidyltransferase